MLGSGAAGRGFPLVTVRIVIKVEWLWNPLRWNPLGNWVILIFSGQKPCTRITSSILHSFSHFSRAINFISCMKYLQRKSFYCSPRKQTSKASKYTNWNLMRDDITFVVFSVHSLTLNYRVLLLLIYYSSLFGTIRACH